MGIEEDQVIDTQIHKPTRQKLRIHVVLTNIRAVLLNFSVADYSSAALG